MASGSDSRNGEARFQDLSKILLKARKQEEEERRLSESEGRGADEDQGE
jgi:hypothetical protein